MSDEERKKALRYLIFLKEKRNSSIKARDCADGRSQRANTTKAETSLQTVALEEMMVASAVDAK